MNIMAVDCDKIDGIWPLIVPNIRRVLKVQAKHGAVTPNLLSIEGVREHIREGKGQLLVIYEDDKVIASVMIEILNTEVGRSLHVTTGAGTRVREWHKMLLQTVLNMAEKYDCNDIRAYLVRPGWIRFMKPFGFEVIGDREYCGDTYPCLSYKMKGKQ